MKNIRVTINSNYDYFGEKQSNPDDYAWSETTFQQMINNRQYQDAADYANNFHFKDPEEDRNWQNSIINLRREGRILSCIYSKIPEDQKPVVDFCDNVFVDGGLDHLQNNDYNEQFREYKRRIGSTDKDEANRLAITFEPHKSTFLGIDWLSPDNDNDIEHFYKNSGLNEQQLRQAGVKVVHKDGKTTLTFDKSNALANTILYNIKDDEGYGNDPVTITGIKRIGNTDSELMSEKYMHSIGGVGMDGVYPLHKVQTLINDAKAIKDKYFADLNLTTKDYSTTIVGPLMLDIEDLQQQLNSGLISTTDYNTQMSIRDKYIQSTLASIGSGNYEMYSNIGNEESSDETLMPLDNKLRHDAVEMISKSGYDKVSLSGMIANGKIGTCVTITAGGLSPETDKYDSDDMMSNIKQRRIQIFIPGLFQKEVQKQINGNTKYNAIQEINNMETWGYEYRTENGNIYISNGDGTFTNSRTNTILDKDKVINEINKDFIKQEAHNNLKYKFVTHDNNMPNMANYINTAKLLAIKAGNDLYPNVGLIDLNGTALSVKDVFNMMSVTGKSIYDDQRVNWEVHNKLNDIFEIYNSLMQDIEYYK